MRDGRSSGFVRDCTQDGFLRYLERLQVSCLIVRSVFLLHPNTSTGSRTLQICAARRQEKSQLQCSNALFASPFASVRREARPAFDVAMDKLRAVAFNGHPGIDWTCHAQGMD